MRMQKAPRNGHFYGDNARDTAVHVSTRANPQGRMNILVWRTRGNTYLLRVSSGTLALMGLRAAAVWICWLPVTLVGYLQFRRDLIKRGRWTMSGASFRTWLRWTS